MAVLHQQSPRSSSGAGTANSFIASVYFQQATAMLDGKMYAEAEHYFREVLQIWPDHAPTWNNLGTACWRQNRLDEAEACHRRALEQNPHDHAILNNLGNVLWERGELDEAADCLRQAIALKPDSAEALHNFGVTLCDLGESDESLRVLRESIRLAPESPDAHVNLGNTLARIGDLDGAFACYAHALELRPHFPEARRNRAYLWLMRGDFARGWPEYEWRLQCAKQHAVRVNSPRWGGEAVPRETILLAAEQGLGDAIQFVRFARSVKPRAARVIVACHEPLLRLFARCAGVDEVVDVCSPLPATDKHIHLMSLPAVLGTSLATIPAAPYLSVDSATTAHWRSIIAQALGDDLSDACSDQAHAGRPITIGIAWQGNRANTLDRTRSFALTHFAALAKLPGVRLISLQKGDGTEQLDALDGAFAVAELADPDTGEDRRDFLDTAAVMSQLDLVITPETAVAHLAGALGVPVWVALSSFGDWRWMLDRADSPWYPSMRLFRQSSAGDWDGVFRRMAEALARHGALAT